ncbi:MAG: TolC family protein [Bacteroidales bacterium]|nr:TolC family protein [Bacteroidales bacterium]
MRKIILTIGIIILGLSINAQNDSVYILNLNEAVDYALENNLVIKNSENEITKAKWKVWETTAIGLPQVNASAEYQLMLDIPTQYMPDFITPAIIGANQYYFGLVPIAEPVPGEKMPVQFGSKHNMSYGASVSQLIFSGEYIVGLQAARTYKMLSEQNYEKAKLELKTTVKQAYYIALIAKQSKEILLINYENIKTLHEESQKIVDAGFASQTSADQMRILELTLKNQISSIERQEELAMLMLKFQMGMLPQDSLVLTTNLDELVKNISLEILGNDFNIGSNMDYQLMNTQVALAKLNLKRSMSTTLPTLSGYYSYSQNAQNDSLIFIDETKQWNPTSVVGIKLSIPIFSSGQRTAVIQQRKIEYDIATNQKEMVEQQLNIQYYQAKSNYINALETLLNQKENLDLAEKIFNETQIKFKQGAASSMDLTQNQNQYLQNESAYYQALMQLLNAQTELEKILNN